MEPLVETPLRARSFPAERDHEWFALPTREGWQIRVYVGTDENGKRKYVNKTVHGNKKTAEKELTKLLRERDLGKLVEPSKITLGHFLDDWLKTSVQPRLRSRTASDYADVVRLYLKPELGSRRLSTLLPVEIRRLYAGMRARSLSARTVRKVHAVLHTALEQAVRDRLIPHNLAKVAADALPRQDRRERRVLTGEEAGHLIREMDGYRLAAYWHLLLVSGLRPGEALGLKWSDLQGDRLQVQRSLVERGGELRFEEPKTPKSRRAVPLPSSTLKALSSHRARQAEEKLAAGPTYQDLDLIFASRTGAALRQSNLHGPFKTLLASAGLPPMRQYDLRHSCATLLLAAGESPKVVAERLGHSTVTLTLDTYSHVLPDMQKAATDKLERLVFGT